MDRTDRDDRKDNANTNEELPHDGEEVVRSAREVQQSGKHKVRWVSTGGKGEPVAPIPLEANAFRVISDSEFNLRLVESLLMSVARKFKGEWLPLDDAAFAEFLSRQVARWGMRVTEADLQAAVRELDLAGSVRVREIDGKTHYRVVKRNRRTR